MKKVLIAFLIVVLLILFQEKMSAYALTDSSGVYHCPSDSQNLDFEKIAYKAAVDKINFGTHDWMAHHEGTSLKEMHDIIVNYNANLYNTYFQTKECLSSNGIDPNSVAQLSDEVIKILAVPEFGPVMELVILVGITGSIVIYRKFSSSL